MHEQNHTTLDPFTQPGKGFFVVSQSVRLTKVSLAKVGVRLLSREMGKPVMLVCEKCGRHWSPVTGFKKRLPDGWWKCPYEPPHPPAATTQPATTKRKAEPTYHDNPDYQEFFALAGVLRDSTIEVILTDLADGTGKDAIARRAFSDRLNNRRRAMADAKLAGWIPGSSKGERMG